MEKESRRYVEFYWKVREMIRHSPDLPKDVFVLLAICFVGLGAFLLGRMGNMEANRRAELRIVQIDTPLTWKSVKSTSDGSASPTKEKKSSGVIPTAANIHGMYVGSRNGTTYYLPWCGGVKLIHEENKVWFATKAEAEVKGYRPAANCKGI